ncbi:hypothetical protein BU25DRAFT_425977 [Macroventuria anomochaeta]|uniref:Uncharacterized protein n=1 Tax=Macroventuria anomochaeta TaxID=301207 RepID=A0ACB6RJ34_9PLEO|nr:uncharacterized protein BU25DRAFT_425977 [Macroventuria anomochaeta]KAF2622011.1 hypothetical protein BU25DRAFT_425977 [Macroventuria anomochaeta]
MSIHFSKRNIHQAMLCRVMTLFISWLVSRCLNGNVTRAIGYGSIGHFGSFSGYPSVIADIGDGTKCGNPPWWKTFGDSYVIVETFFILVTAVLSECGFPSNAAARQSVPHGRQESCRPA